MSRLSKANETQLRQIEDAWLGIDIPDEDIFDPSSIIEPDDPEIHLKITWMLTKPEYFSFLCSQILNIDILPSQSLMLHEMWNRKFPMLIASRGFGKSFILSLYSIIRALILPNRKIVIVGAAFRQSKVLFEYMENIWNNAPILRDMCDSDSGPRRSNDRNVLHINGSTVTCLPLGDGTKIRGQRANDIIADEFASIPRDIFETVVSGFGVVSASPIENVKDFARRAMAAELGIELEEDEEEILSNKDNQIIFSGTAYYDFNHFSDYWKKWRRIIHTRGNPDRIRELFGGEDPPEEFDHKQYSVIRIPYELLPAGFMDAAHVARSKATVHAGIYQMEYGAVFTRDSQGFLRRSLIESCVCNKDNPIKDVEGNDIEFYAQLSGSPKKQYVFGVDPASEIDNFSIVVLELNPCHRRIVYCWTIRRSEHREKVKSGEAKETDFYSFCGRKIRDLMKRFPCVHIAMDSGGGGIPIEETLHDPDKIEEGEQPIWQVIDPDDEKDTDDYKGLHILEMCSFSDYQWLREANHGMRKDFEDKLCLFPMFDSLSQSLANMEDDNRGRKYDTLEECVLEIEELKDELAMIEMEQTATGREKWDTPEIIVGTGKKDKIRKDRYSALMMANMAARNLGKGPQPIDPIYYGGFAVVAPKDSKVKGQLMTGPAWFTDGIEDVY